MGHGAGLARLDRQARLGAVERLDLATSRRPRAPRHACGGSTYRPTMSSSLAANSGSFERLKVRMRCGCRPCAAQIRCTERKADARSSRPSPGRSSGSPRRAARRRSARPRGARWHRPRGALPGLRVLSRSSPSTPASTKRSCQRQTAGRPTPARRATSATFSRSAEPRMIRARATCFWARLRSATIASRRARSSAETNGQTI